MAPTAEGEASKVKVKVRMSIHGTFFLKSATMIERVHQEEVELPSVESMDTSSSETKPEQPAATNGSEAEMTTPSDPTPSEPTPNDSTPSEPATGDSAPSEPASGDSAPSEPAADDSAPNDGVEKMETPEEATDQGEGTASQDSDSSPNLEKKSVKLHQLTINFVSVVVFSEILDKRGVMTVYGMWGHVHCLVLFCCQLFVFVGGGGGGGQILSSKGSILTTHT